MKYGRTPCKLLLEHQLLEILSTTASAACHLYRYAAEEARLKAEMDKRVEAERRVIAEQRAQARAEEDTRRRYASGDHVDSEGHLQTFHAPSHQIFTHADTAR